MREHGRVMIFALIDVDIDMVNHMLMNLAHNVHIALKFEMHIHGPQRIKPIDFAERPDFRQLKIPPANT